MIDDSENIMEKPGFGMEVSSIEYNALRALNEKPDKNDSNAPGVSHIRVERAATHIPDKGCGWQASASGMPDRATNVAAGHIY